MKEKVRELLKEKNAIMLAHNYQLPEIQDTTDMCGDSLELSRKAARTDADIIVFCGVHFMAETASILSPDKTVLLPQTDAGCEMADMITAESLQEKIHSLPPMPVVTYVNSTAAVKALSTICCTSANVVKIAESLDAAEILMTPDRNLAKYAESRTGKKIHIWDGCCPYHDRLTPAQVAAAREEHPEAVFMAHPECRPEIIAQADVVASTSGMIKHAQSASETEFIVGTEVGLLHTLNKQNPEKKFFPAAEELLCPDMKKITLADVANCLENFSGEVKVPEETRLPALAAVERMIAI